MPVTVAERWNGAGRIGPEHPDLRSIIRASKEWISVVPIWGSDCFVLGGDIAIATVVRGDNKDAYVVRAVACGADKSVTSLVTSTSAEKKHFESMNAQVEGQMVLFDPLLQSQAENSIVLSCEPGKQRIDTYVLEDDDNTLIVHHLFKVLLSDTTQN
ncbi:MAG: hypothetical protein KDA69_01575 [Planctomycetaceae bacterium]|nr:hypothetical protein [Planctomycetaceae bacterium]MCA9032438.1 hypothetical protein [Planctomycetaceae bacterium]MCA9042977.1 hypothetical protein [Planctomycetaceae bacterium]MCB9952726.1 hypothetical protein [Planctomycetaceae bacterium]